MTFHLYEILSFLGLTQALYVLVYMLTRSGNWRFSIIPCFYFGVLCAAFLMDGASLRLASDMAIYAVWQMTLWFFAIPLGVLLILQVAFAPALPYFKYFFLLFFIPLMAAVSVVLPRLEVIGILGLTLGGLSLLTVWLRRDLLDGLDKNPKQGGERFWLILSLMVLNTGFLGAVLAFLVQAIDYQSWVLIRTLLGIGISYAAATGLLRLYPQAVKLATVKGTSITTLEDKAHIETLNKLLTQDKVYQEPAYGRTEMARELGVAEPVLSRLVNHHFNKTIPQLLNEYRVKDAQRLLLETDAPIQQIFAESGFNSITTFNRVFKELTGLSPSEFRDRANP